jgi:hypothetical protein
MMKTSLFSPTNHYKPSADVLIREVAEFASIKKFWGLRAYSFSAVPAGALASSASAKRTRLKPADGALRPDECQPRPIGLTATGLGVDPTCVLMA